jgi:hypothetical protein
LARNVESSVYGLGSLRTRKADDIRACTTHGSLARGQVLECSDERESDRLPFNRQVSWVSFRRDELHGHRLEPRRLGPDVEVFLQWLGAGPRSIGRMRRSRLLSMSMHTLVAIR